MLNFLAWKQDEKKVVHIEEAPYKQEPAKEIIEECEKVADKFKVDPLGDIGCPVPPEVE